MLFCDRPTASVIIRNMIKLGWVRRDKDPDNAKHVQVKLTPKGKSKIRVIQGEKPEKNSKVKPLESFTNEEIKTLLPLTFFGPCTV